MIETKPDDKIVHRDDGIVEIHRTFHCPQCGTKLVRRVYKSNANRPVAYCSVACRNIYVWRKKRGEI